MKPVLICGGVGTKMWPASSPQLPKHFLPLIDGRSLFRLNYETLLKKFKPEEIFVQTTESQKGLVKAEAPEVPEENIFLEPEARNTGPAIGLMAALLSKMGYGDEPFVLVQVDDLREPDNRFLEMIEVMGKMALESDKYITGGFKPERVVRGVDYLVKGKLISEENGIMVYEVADYIDRTETEKIEKYLGSEDLLLHTNHTTMTPNNYLKMYRELRIDWYEPLAAIVTGGDITENFLKMAKGPQEEVTPMMYRSGRSIVVEIPFTWVDFGTWESVAIYQDTRDKKPELRAKIEIEANNNFVRMDDKSKPVALIGVNDLVVVDTPNGLLICKKDQSGRVGEVVRGLENRN